MTQDLSRLTEPTNREDQTLPISDIKGITQLCTGENQRMNINSLILMPKKGSFKRAILNQAQLLVLIQSITFSRTTTNILKSQTLQNSTRRQTAEERNLYSSERKKNNYSL